MNDEHDSGEALAVEVISSDLGQVVSAEIDQQIATAHKFPRHSSAAQIVQFRQNVLNLATVDKETAGECRFALKRGGKVIAGNTIRFAEIVAHAWGNLRIGTRIVSIDQRHVTCQGAVHDLENNFHRTFEVKRRCTKRDGTTFDDDMIQMTCAAAQSIAARNAIFSAVPRAIWKKAEDAVVDTIRGDMKTLVERRKGAFDYFSKLGVQEARVLRTLDKPNLESVDLDDLVILTGIRTAIKDGDTTMEEAFPDRTVRESRDLPPVGKAAPRDDLAEALDQAMAQQAAVPEPEEPIDRPEAVVPLQTGRPIPVNIPVKRRPRTKTIQGEPALAPDRKAALVAEVEALAYQLGPKAVEFLPDYLAIAEMQIADLQTVRDDMRREMEKAKAPAVAEENLL